MCSRAVVGDADHGAPSVDWWRHTSEMAGAAPWSAISAQPSSMRSTHSGDILRNSFLQFEAVAANHLMDAGTPPRILSIHESAGTCIWNDIAGGMKGPDSVTLGAGSRDGASIPGTGHPDFCSAVVGPFLQPGWYPERAWAPWPGQAVAHCSPQL